VNFFGVFFISEGDGIACSFIAITYLFFVLIYI
jgi:hypothetical protein